MKPTIGIEVHAELKTKSKMFCGCKNDPHQSAPNENTCPVCLAHPGSLPTVNKVAVEKVLTVGKAIDARLATYSEFDRKNYFYPDIPKAYQLSQYAYPFVEGGELAGVKITRVHLEEDTARSQHEGNNSIVDFNRAGVPLMELVTEPVIHDAKTAVLFAKELQLLLRSLDVSEANMEKGEMRVEANISVSPNNELGTKVEVKNLNSFKAVEQAILYEIKRQTALIEAGERVVQETRGWDENKNSTFSQRSKEKAEEYRYFPDPDIPKYNIEKIDISRLDEMLPNIPSKIRTDFSTYGLKNEQIETLIYNRALFDYFAKLADAVDKNEKILQLGASYITSDIAGLLQSDSSLQLDVKTVEVFAELLSMLAAGEVNSRVAKDILSEVVFMGSSPKKIAEDKGLLQQNSEADLLPIVQKVIDANESVVIEFKSGKDSALQFLVGQVMKETKGAANPSVASQILRKQIG